MPYGDHAEILKRGVKEWNDWRAAHLGKSVTLGMANLQNLNLKGANLIQAELIETDLRSALLDGAGFWNSDLSDALLNGTSLIGADFREAILTRSRLFDANLTQASLEEANCTGAFFNNANLTGASLIGTNFGGARLTNADFTNATMGWTHFGANDLSDVRGLETVRHQGPSYIDIHSIYRSKGIVSEVFLRGAGVSDDFIAYMRSLVGQAIEFYSCFISYSHEDEEFAKRLHSRLRDSKIMVWFAPEDMKGGEKLHDQIERAIQMHDRLLVSFQKTVFKVNG